MRGTFQRPVLLSPVGLSFSVTEGLEIEMNLPRHRHDSPETYSKLSTKELNGGRNLFHSVQRARNPTSRRQRISSERVLLSGSSAVKDASSHLGRHVF